MSSVKIIHKNEIRRIRLEDIGGKLGDVQQFVSTMFKQLPRPFEVKYKDDEGDLVTITTDQELNEAIRLYKVDMGGKVLRLLVTEAVLPSPRVQQAKPDESKKAEEPKRPAFTFRVVVAKQKESDPLDVTVEKHAITLAKLVEAVVKAMPGLKSNAVDMRYKDDENDLITMTDDKDLEECISFMVNDTIEIHVSPAKTVEANPPSPVKAQKPVEAKPECPVKKAWRDMTWEDIDKVCTQLQKLGFKDHARNTEFVAKFEGDWDKILHALKSLDVSQPTISDLYSTD